MGFLTLLRRRGTSTSKKIAGDRLVAAALGGAQAAARCDALVHERTSFASTASDDTSGDGDLLAP
jgi:hypothetical protein